MLNLIYLFRFYLSWENLLLSRLYKSRNSVVMSWEGRGSGSWAVAHAGDAVFSMSFFISSRAIIGRGVPGWDRGRVGQRQAAL